MSTALAKVTLAKVTLVVVSSGVVSSGVVSPGVVSWDQRTNPSSSSCVQAITSGIDFPSRNRANI